MIEMEASPFEEKEIGLTFKIQQHQKLEHAIKHDTEDEAIIEALNDPDEIIKIVQDLIGTRRIIFSLLIDLGMVPTTYRFLDRKVVI